MTIIILLQSHVSDVACVNWTRRKHGRVRWRVANEVRVLQVEAARQLCCHPPQLCVVQHCSEHYCAHQWRWLKNRTVVSVRRHPSQLCVVQHCSEHYCAHQWRWLKNRTVVSVRLLSNGLRNVRPVFDSRHWHSFVHLSVHFWGPSQGDPSSGLKLDGGGKWNQHVKLKLTSIYCLG